MNELRQRHEDYEPHMLQCNEHSGNCAKMDALSDRITSCSEHLEKMIKGRIIMLTWIIGIGMAFTSGIFIGVGSYLFGIASNHSGRIGIIEYKQIILDQHMGLKR